MPIYKYIIILFLLIPFKVSAEITISAVMDKSVVGPGDRINLVYHISSPVSEFFPPDFKPLLILKGPEIAKEGNGVRYSYILKAVRPGDVFISQAKALANGKTYKSNSLMVIVKGSLPAEKVIPEMNMPAKNPIDNEAEKIIENYVYIKPVFERKNYYAGENLALKYILYVHSDIVLTKITEPQPPLFESWWVDEEAIPKLSYTNETINGVEFRTAVLRKYVLNALRPGTYSIPQFTLRINTALEFSDQFENDDKYYRKALDCKSKAEAISIMPLPNPPQGFTGAVGEFRISSSMNKQNVGIGETVRLRFIVSGTGNFQHIGVPTLVLPEGISAVGSAESSVNLNYQNGVSGEKYFDFTISADKAGEYYIGQISFPYFSANAEKYIVLNSEPQMLTVGKERTAVSDEKVTGSVNGNWFKIIGYISLALIGALIVYLIIKKRQGGKEEEEIEEPPNPQRGNNEQPLAPHKPNSSPFGGQGVGFLSFILRKRKGGTSEIKIEPKSTDYVSDISNLRNENDKELLNDISDILFKFLAEKFKLPQGNSSREFLRNRMVESGISNVIIDELFDYLDKLDRLRFTQTTTVVDLQLLKEQAKRIIQNMSTII